MKISNLKVLLEDETPQPTPPPGKVLIAWSNRSNLSYKGLTYGENHWSYQDRVREAIGPLADTQHAKHVDIKIEEEKSSSRVYVAKPLNLVFKNERWVNGFRGQQRAAC